MDAIYNRFCSYLPLNAKICDLGCGSGRDSLYFKSQGYNIIAIDGSLEMCNLASDLLELPVENLMFNQLDYTDEFDAIWACSSLLHVPKKEMADILSKIVCACKKKAIMYTCFKYGTDEIIKNDCHYSNYDEIQLKELINIIKFTSIKEIWMSYDVLRKENETPQWINVILEINKQY